MTDTRIIKHCSEGRDGNLILSPLSGMWANCPVLGAGEPYQSAFGIHDDFVEFAVGDATSRWTLDAVNATAVLGTQETHGFGGVLVMAVQNNDNDVACVKLTSTDTGGPFSIVSNSGYRLWFEARIYASLATDESFYLGLFTDDVTDPGVDNDGTHNLGGAQDGVYFRTVNATPTELDWAFGKNGSETEQLGAAATWASTTWTRLGFYFDGITSVVPYVNGAIISSGAIASTGETNFPDDVGLTPVMSIKCGTTATREMWVDYIKVVQERV